MPSLSPHADIIVRDVRVRGSLRTRSGEWAREWGSAVAVRGDRVVGLGSNEDVTEFIGPQTRVVSAPGGLVLPGFQDAHVHPPTGGRNLRQVWLNDTHGRDAYLAEIARYATAHPDSPWIVGGGWAMEYFPGGAPRKEDLDAVVPDRPVFLFNRDVHGAWVNSRALEIGGITGETPDPADGRIERDPDTGEPSGTLHEGAAYTFDARHVPLPDAREWEECLLAGQRHLHGLGVTGWQDAWVTPTTLDTYCALARDGRLTARAVGALWWERSRGLEQIEDLVEQRAQASGSSIESGSGVPGFFPTSVKIMLDGVLENNTGALLEPYCDGCGGHTNNRGLNFLDPALLAEAVTRLDSLGFQVHMHAIGDRAVRDGLDAVAAARAVNPDRDLRHHIAHVQVVHPDDVKRFARLGVVANCQPYWAQYEPQMTDLTMPFLGEERTAWQYPFASFLSGGTTIAMGSDWAVTTANPLEEMEVAITRINPEERDNECFLPSERITLDQALDGFTVGSAFVNHDDVGGVLAVGQRADVVLLDLDICATGFATAERAPLADATVQLTVSGGRIVHDVT
jgi:predicted amidohydrolase YtcJ